MFWDADNKDSASKTKRDSIVNYMRYATKQDRFKKEVTKALYDYIHTGNAIGVPEWVDERVQVSTGVGSMQVGYVGPTVRRISPLDIVFNPIAPSFSETPKIVRSVVSMGEVKKILDSQTNDENKEAYDKLYNYLLEYRQSIQLQSGDLAIQDEYLRIDGFTSMRAYMESDYVEILTFYGDIFDWETKTFLQNHIIMVVDRHKVICKKPNPSYFGTVPMAHVGWRPRQDNLWAMGPLANLVGMQYRLDHTENCKADILDLIAYPVMKVKGYVEPFIWQPMEKIVTDGEGDVELVTPSYQVLQLNQEIGYLTGMMEEMAGSPKEAMGFRTPGEKTAYEVQRLENAAARIFMAKISQFEEQFLEPLLNGMLELARRNIDGAQVISVFDDEFNFTVFQTLTPMDLAGAGKLRPLGARHFAEKSELIQNWTSFMNSPIGQDPAVLAHISGLQEAKLFTDLLDMQDYGIFGQNIRVSEMADTERLKNVLAEKIQMEAQTPSGLTPDDHDGDEALPSSQDAPPPDQTAPPQ
jgi:hypothetical protein